MYAGRGQEVLCAGPWVWNHPHDMHTACTYWLVGKHVRKRKIVGEQGAYACMGQKRGPQGSEHVLCSLDGHPDSISFRGV